MVETIRMLRREHADMAKLLGVLEWQVGVYQTRGTIDRRIVADVLDYCMGYPALCHHPKEDLIYDKLRLVGEEDVVDALGDLRAEHGELERLTKLFQTAVDNLLPDAEIPRDKFVHVAMVFIDRYRRHMDKEDELLFPAALRSISEEDWTEIDRKAIDLKDPVFGDRPEQRFQALRDEILRRDLADGVQLAETS